MKYLLLICFLFSLKSTMAGMVHGRVVDENDHPLSGTTIFVPEIQLGTVTNSDGYYELNLQPGKYTIVFRYQGYESSIVNVICEDEPLLLEIKMIPRTLVLQEVKVMAGKEDPAYTIMRKAIAKAAYHRNIVDSFSSQVYMKGKGKLENIPFFLRPKLRKEGIDTSRVFIGESVSRITYKRPNIYDEQVLSVRSSGDDNNSSPLQYITNSFYEPELVETISPLSPRAFNYYRFEYIDTFTDQGYDISRIKVIPKSVGDHLFEGEISLVEDQWALHSINLKSSKLGIGIGIKQMYAPFSGVTWLPVSNKFHITGNIWGVKFYYDYLASINYSVVVTNKELSTEITLVDAKKDEVRAKEVEELNFKVKTAPDETKVAKNTKKELTAEDFKRQLKEYEKEELKQQKENDVLLSYAYRIDSLAYKRPKEYWENVRSVPLTALELKGYYQVDSLAGNLEKDSVNKMKISPSDFLIGKYYRIDKNNRVILRGLLRETGFNTVEGLFTDFQVSHIYRKLINYDIPNGDRKSYFIRSNIYLKYSLARNKLLPYANVEYEFRDKSSSFNWLIKGGQRTVQINREEPIPHILNSFYTLILENNLIKIYQANELKTFIRNRFSGKVTLEGSFGWESRLPLENQTNFTIINWPDLEYTSNNPLNTSLIDTTFPKHNHTSASMELELRPWLKYRMINGRKYPIRRTSPVVRLKTHWAIPDILGGTTDYMKFKGSFSYTVDPGVFAELNIFAAYESFLYKNQLYFPDFIHFSGNQTVFSKGTDFRQLQYYNYSHDKNAIYLITNMQFKRNILIAAIPTFARKGIRDYTFFNFLHTREIPSYLELGYGLNYVFKFLKFEGVVSFIDQKFNSVGIRIGLAPEIEF